MWKRLILILGSLVFSCKLVLAVDSSSPSYLQFRGDSGPPDPVNFSIKDLSAGMVSYPDANQIPDNSANYIQNFFTDVQGIAQERTGTVQKETTVLGGTSPVTGLWDFLDVNGAEWLIAYSSNTFYKEQPGGTFVSFGPKTSIASNVVYATNNLGKIWFVDGVDSLWWFDGTSTGAVAAAPVGNLIASWRNRIAIGNIVGSQSEVQFSKDGDGLTWTVGPGDSDPFIIQVGGANDGFPINCLYGMYQDTLFIGRKFDMWGTYGFTQSDQQTRRLTSEIGCLQNGTMKESDGDLIWLSARGLERLNGSNIQIISDPIRDITDKLVKNTINNRSVTQNGVANWNAGTITPSGNLFTPTNTSILELSTQAATTFADTFSSGTLVQVSTTASLTNVVLSFQASATPNQQYGADNGTAQGCGNPNSYIAQSFTATTNYLLTGVTLRLSSGGNPGNTHVDIRADSSGTPAGTPINSGTLTASQVSGANSDVTVTIPTTTILSGQRYWITLDDAPGNGSCPPSGNPGNLYSWADTNGSFSEYLIAFNYNKSTAVNTKYKTVGLQYNFAGTYTSPAFDVGFTTNTWLWQWGTYGIGFVLPPATSLTFATQTSSSSTGVWGALSSTISASGSPITSTVKEFIRYQANFTSTTGVVTPTLNNVSLGAGPFIKSSGTFTSSVMTLGTLITKWGGFNTLQDTSAGGTINYQICSSSSANLTLSSCSAITANSFISITTNSYAQVTATFTVTASTQNPILKAFVVNWYEGQSAYNVGWTWDRRYWVAFTTSTASNPSLDTILVYQRNKTFTLLKGVNAASFARWRDNLYFGDSTGSTGLVYQYDVGNSDNGNPITAIVRTKSYDLGYPYRDKDVKKMYVGLNESMSYTGSLTMTYDMDRSGNAYPLGAESMMNYNGMVEAKFPFPLTGTGPTQGREVQYTLTKSDVGNPLNLYEFRTMFYLKEAT